MRKSGDFYGIIKTVEKCRQNSIESDAISDGTRTFDTFLRGTLDAVAYC